MLVALVLSLLGSGLCGGAESLNMMIGGRGTYRFAARDALDRH